MSAAIVLVFCRAIIGSVFALSAGGKALDFSAFRESVADFRLLPSGWSRTVAWAFLACESAVVFLMAIGGPALLIGFALATSLLLVFSTGLIVTLRRGTGVSCNCFGRTERRISFYDVARNAVLIGCGLGGAWALLVSSGSVSRPEIVLTFLMASCIIVLVINLRDVVETLRQPFRVE